VRRWLPLHLSGQDTVRFASAAAASASFCSSSASEGSPSASKHACIFTRALSPAARRCLRVSSRSSRARRCISGSLRRIFLSAGSKRSLNSFVSMNERRLSSRLRPTLTSRTPRACRASFFCRTSLRETLCECMSACWPTPLLRWLKGARAAENPSSLPCAEK